MPDAPDRIPHRIVRLGVVLTALLCFGMAGYAGQIWWAKRVISPFVKGFAGKTPDQKSAVLQKVPFEWRSHPWHGSWKPGFGWLPRRIYYEYLKQTTGLDLGNSPDAWEAWFKAHPNLIWDERLRRLVEPPTSR